jgi:hypothetical protein
MKNLSNPKEPPVQTTGQYYELRFNRLEKSIAKALGAGPTTLQKVDIDFYDVPTENEVVVDWPRARLCWYHDGKWFCTPPDPEHDIKVFDDVKTNAVRDGAFRFSVPKSLDNHEIIWVESFNGTAGGSNTIVQISNRTRNLDILSTRLTIAGGGYDSSTGADAVIRKDIVGDRPANVVKWKERIWIDCDAGGGGKGLGVYILYRYWDPDVVTGAWDPLVDDELE